MSVKVGNSECQCAQLGEILGTVASATLFSRFDSMVRGPLTPSVGESVLGWNNWWVAAKEILLDRTDIAVRVCLFVCSSSSFSCSCTRYSAVIVFRELHVS